MEKKFSDNIRLLIKDGEAIEHIPFSILLSFKRNIFFAHLENYINFYNRLRTALKDKYKNKAEIHNSLEKIPELNFEDYSISAITHFVLLTTFPVSFVLFIIQWNYVKEIKRKLTIGLNEFHSLMRERE